jgi:hypothetical protein
MWGNDPTLRLLTATVAGLALYVGVLASRLFEGAPPEHTLKPAHAAPVPSRRNDAARPFLPGLCFRGPQGEATDFALVRHCP